MKVRTIQLLILFTILFALVPCVAQAKIVAISRGFQTVLAMDDQGKVWMWGNGTPPGNAQLVPIDNVTAIVAGGACNYALKNDGTVWAWGYGGNGRLGNGGTESHDTPVQVSGLTDVVAISAGNLNGYALKSDGTVWAWGMNDEGQLGIGTYGTPRFTTTPVQVSGLADIVLLGDYGGYAVRRDGTVYTWLNDTLSYPDGRPVTFPVPYVDNVKQIVHSAIWPHTIYLKNDGTVWGWGDNEYGEMGDGTYKPVIMVNSTWFEKAYVWPPVQTTIADVKQIAGGLWGFTDALKNDGTVWEWGRTQLERPRTNNWGVLSPMRVSGLDHIVQICPGLALKDDGTVWGWGQNFDKWLEDSSDTEIKTSPIMIFEEPQLATPTPTQSPTATPTTAPSNTSTPTVNPTVTPVVTPVPSNTIQPTAASTPSPDDSGLLLPVAGIVGLVLVAGLVVYLWISKRL